MCNKEGGDDAAVWLFYPVEFADKYIRLINNYLLMADADTRSVQQLHPCRLYKIMKCEILSHMGSANEVR